jgi:hypothetical protein
MSGEVQPSESKHQEWPNGYTPELAEKFLDALAAKPLSVGRICADLGLVSRSTIYRWLENDIDGFREKYARAREAGLEPLAEEIIDISDDGRNDYIPREGADGEVLGDMVNHDHIARSRLRVDSRKWLLSKLLPKKYGDRMAAEISGPDGGPIQTEGRSVEDMAAFAGLLAEAKAKVAE